MVKKTTPPLVHPRLQMPLRRDDSNLWHGLDGEYHSAKSGTMPSIVDRRIDRDRIPWSSDGEMAQLEVGERFEHVKGQYDRGVRLLGIYNIDTR